MTDRGCDVCGMVTFRGRESVPLLCGLRISVSGVSPTLGQRKRTELSMADLDWHMLHRMIAIGRPRCMFKTWDRQRRVADALPCLAVVKLVNSQHFVVVLFARQGTRQNVA